MVLHGSMHPDGLVIRKWNGNHYEKRVGIHHSRFRFEVIQNEERGCIYAPHWFLKYILWPNYMYIFFCFSWLSTISTNAAKTTSFFTIPFIEFCNIYGSIHFACDTAINSMKARQSTYDLEGLNDLAFTIYGEGRKNIIHPSFLKSLLRHLSYHVKRPLSIYMDIFPS